LAYKVFLLDPARTVLESLAATDRPQARALALILLSLRKNPKPQSSRGLAPTVTSPIPGGRIWERPDWIITYKVDESAETVDIGKIESPP
jgi:hypothetical protein